MYIYIHIVIIYSSRQTLQGPDRLYKAPTDYTKPRKTIESPEKNIQTFKILDKTSKC